MKVVALISGGKDSTMNMMECLARGHEIIALANLYPVEQEELDSYMYQSVGHDAILAFAKCCDMPLYRRPITGKPVNQAYEYVPTEKDEVEDLYVLLEEIKRRHPEIDAVSSGAIFSTYQKNRVENVCERLGMTSLAYLWHREQRSLLHEMIQKNLHAVLIKTAVIGLSGNDLLKSLAEMEPKLLVLENLYKINVCGEGGEFETLTLDCPLFKNLKLQITGYEIRTHKECTFAPVSYVKITGIECVLKH